MKEIRCPYCRSLLRYDGKLSFSAPQIQVKTCPVCRYPNWIATDYPLPILWVDVQVIEENKPLKPYEETLPPASYEPPPAKTQEPLYDINILNPLQNFGAGIYKIGIWIAVVLVLILLIKRR